MTTHAGDVSSSEGPLEAVVIGAGIAGLTAAHELAERGFAVTVYESKLDERPNPADGELWPDVKLGGLAASQFATAEPSSQERGGLRRFPTASQVAETPTHVPGEHGFRFFPGYYLHLMDMLRRIPVFENVGSVGTSHWVKTERTVHDNVKRVVTQAVTSPGGEPSVIFPRRQPESDAEQLTLLMQMSKIGYEGRDIRLFGERLIRFLVTSPERRRELHNVSSYEFLKGEGRSDGPSIQYSPGFETLLLEMPKVLAAFDGEWGDARTNLATYLQLQFQMERTDNKADGVLSGPTTESWFDHWYRYLVGIGVRFVPQMVKTLEATPPNAMLDRPLRTTLVLADGRTVVPDYVIVAVDAPAAERISADLRTAGTGGAVAQLDGFSTSVPPATGPLQEACERSGARRDPRDMASMGRLPWDRLQTLSGIQYYFGTAFQLVAGHVYHSGSPWRLSSINQHAIWTNRPVQLHDGFVSVLSVDIGDWNALSPTCLNDAGQPMAARDCTPGELALEVWRQIQDCLAVTPPGERRTDDLPQPLWYAIDRNIEYETNPDGSDGVPIRNHAPYLVPVVGDWDNRPGSYPWNPNGTSPTWLPTARQRQELTSANVWQAEHGGYQVHNDSVVFAGTWTKTFTRMTTMEAACESARHAVNAVLDHALWIQSGKTDTRAQQAPQWRSPYGFLDQDGSIGVRTPTPLGDYCFVFDLENREPFETRFTRTLDSTAYLRGLPHPWDALKTMDNLTNEIDPLSMLTKQIREAQQWLQTTLSGSDGYTWPEPPPLPPTGKVPNRSTPEAKPPQSPEKQAPGLEKGDRLAEAKRPLTVDPFRQSLFQARVQSGPPSHKPASAFVDRPGRDVNLSGIEDEVQVVAGSAEAEPSGDVGGPDSESTNAAEVAPEVPLVGTAQPSKKTQDRNDWMFPDLMSPADDDSPWLPLMSGLADGTGQAELLKLIPGLANGSDPAEWLKRLIPKDLGPNWETR